MTAKNPLAGTFDSRLDLSHTILCLAEPGLEVIQGQVRHSALEIVEIHLERTTTKTVRLKR